MNLNRKEFPHEPLPEGNGHHRDTDDLGEFRAVVSTYDRDREGDRVLPGAFQKTINEWRSVGRQVPLHCEHDPHEIVGDVDPEEMREDPDAGGLVVSGRVDLDDDLGRRLWKSLKNNRIAFSFGFLANEKRERPDGGFDLIELDVFEFSITASPANNRTRVLSVKSMNEPRSRASSADRGEFSDAGDAGDADPLQTSSRPSCPSSLRSRAVQGRQPLPLL